jgi:hypothetical protein
MQTDWQRSLDAFHAVSSSADEVLSDVYERETDGSVDGLALVFTHRVLLFEADGEDDTISVRWKPISRFRSDGLKSVRSAKVWRSLLQKSFGWGWLTINEQGYCDGALLSFDGIRPCLCLEVIGSSIKIGQVIRDAAPSISVVGTLVMGNRSQGLWSTVTLSRASSAPLAEAPG